MQQKFSRALLEEIRRLMLSNQPSKARKLVSELSTSRVPREHVLRVAFLARSVGLRERAARLLFPVVRGRNRAAGQASDEEKAEYAITLAQLGAADEALQLLGEVDPRKLPRVDRFAAMSYFRLWEWDKAKPRLERLLKSPDLAEGDVLWGKFYLAASLIHGTPELERAQLLLEEVLKTTSLTHFPALYVDTLNLLAQVSYFAKKWGVATRFLERLKKVEDIAGDPVWFEHLISCWEANIALGSGQGDRDAALRKLRHAKQGAFANRRWELSRVCAYYESLHTHDEKLVQHLYFGTPFPGMRRKLLSMLGRDASSLPSYYDLHVGREGRPKLTLSATNGRNTLNDAYLKENQLQCRLLKALVDDFYRQPNAAELHSLVYPGEHFNPSSSPVRVRQGLKRLRQWLAAHRLPLKVDENRNVYSLDSESSLALRVNSRDGAPETEASAHLLHLLAAIQKKVGVRAFSAREAEEAMGLARWATVSHLREAEKHGLVKKLGKGPSTRYAINK